MVIRRKLKSVLALTLAAGLAFFPLSDVSDGLKVHAADDVNEEVFVPNDEGDTDVTVGNITIGQTQNSVEGAEVVSEGKDVSLTVEGNITINGGCSSDYSDGIDIYTENYGSATVNVAGNISVNADNYSDGGIFIGAEDGSKAEVTVDGNVSVTAPSSVVGVNNNSDDENTETNVSIGGDIIAESEYSDASGIENEVEDGAKSTVYVGGDVTAKSGEGEAYGIVADIDGEGSEADISVGGDVLAQSEEDEANGIYTEISNQSALTISVGGNVLAQSIGNTATGIDAETADESTITISVDGDILALSDETSVCGISDEIYEDSTSYINVRGDVSAQSGKNASVAFGIYGEAVDGADSNILVGGDVSAQGGDERAFGIFTEDENATRTILVKGNIEAADGEVCYGAQMSASDGSETSLLVGGDIVAEGIKSAVGIGIQGSDSYMDALIIGQINAMAQIAVGAMIVSVPSDEGGDYSLFVCDGINVEGSQDAGNMDSATGAMILATGNNQIGLYSLGDIVSNGTGIILMKRNYTGKTEIVVNGTIDAEACGIYNYANVNTEAANPLDEGAEFTEGDVDITVWKICLNESGNVAEIMTSEDDEVLFKADEETESKIMYIIKVKEDDYYSLSATKEDGSALDISSRYNVAKEGDKVLLNVDLLEGYELVGVYNGLDDEVVEIVKDDDGKYYYIVPKGGGVYLFAEVELQEYELTFIYPDGTTNVMKVKYGDEITIPEGVEVEGYEFCYWLGSKYYPGDKYVVTGAHQFTAVYEKTEEEPEEEEPEEKVTPEEDSEEEKKEEPEEITPDEEKKEEPKEAETSVNEKVTKKDSAPTTGDAGTSIVLFIFFISAAGLATTIYKRKN